MKHSFRCVQGAIVAQQHELDSQILQHFHLHMRSISHAHDSDMKKVHQSLASLSSQIDNIPGPSMDAMPVVQDAQMDPSMVRSGS